MVKIKSPRAPTRTSFVSNYCHLCPTIAVSPSRPGQNCPRFPEEVQLLAVGQQRPGFCFQDLMLTTTISCTEVWRKPQTWKNSLINWKWTVCCAGHHDVLTTTKEKGRMEKESSTSKTNGPDHRSWCQVRIYLLITDTCSNPARPINPTTNPICVHLMPENSLKPAALLHLETFN